MEPNRQEPQSRRPAEGASAEGGYTPFGALFGSVGSATPQGALERMAERVARSSLFHATLLSLSAIAMLLGAQFILNWDPEQVRFLMGAFVVAAFGLVVLERALVLLGRNAHAAATGAALVKAAWKEGWGAGSLPAPPASVPPAADPGEGYVDGDGKEVRFITVYRDAPRAAIAKPAIPAVPAEPEPVPPAIVQAAEAPAAALLDLGNGALVREDDFAEFVRRASGLGRAGLVRELWLPSDRAAYTFESGVQLSREAYDAIIEFLRNKLKVVEGSTGKGARRYLRVSADEVLRSLALGAAPTARREQETLSGADSEARGAERTSALQ